MTFSLLRVSAFIEKYSRDVEHDSSRILKSVRKVQIVTLFMSSEDFFFIGNICEMTKVDEIKLISIIFFNPFQYFLRKNIDIEKVGTKQLLNTVGW